MRKFSKCCHAKLHQQNDVFFCTNCISVLDNSEIQREMRPIIIVSSVIMFLYMVLNTSFAHAPQNLTNSLKYTFSKIEQPTKYAIDYIQVKIIEGNKSNAVSVAGAVGNMQIMPVSLEDWNKQHPSQKYSMDDMTNEAKNVKVGKWMLEKRIPEILNSKKVPLTINHILIAYNWGCGNLVNWYKSGAVVARLPMETQQYICKYWAKAKI